MRERRMPPRRALGWLTGLAAVTVAAAGLAAALLWISADLTVQADRFFSSLGPDGVDREVFDHWDTVSRNAYFLQGLAAPVLLPAVAGVMTILAVLARWWDLDQASGAPAD